jgi:methanogenic corrinoid protein MtbC1
MYSETDVAMVKRLSALRATGLSASEAAKMVLRESVESGLPVSYQPPSGIVERLLSAVHRMDSAAIDDALLSLGSFGNAADAFERVIAPALVEVGRAWQEGEINEAHEHLFSEHLSMTLRNWLSLSRPANPRGTALVGCFAEELHTIPAYGIALRWSSYGIRTVFLGARMTPSAVRASIRQLAPSLVGLSLTMPATEKQTSYLREYSAACGPVPWVVGGAGVYSIQAQVLIAGGIVLSPSIEAQKNWLDSVLQGYGRGYGR